MALTEQQGKRRLQAEDVDLTLNQRASGLLENLSQSHRKLTCEGPVPITASLAEGHHLAEIYCTITRGAAVTVCKIKAPQMES